MVNKGMLGKFTKRRRTGKRKGSRMNAGTRNIKKEAIHQSEAGYANRGRRKVVMNKKEKEKEAKVDIYDETAT